MRMTVEAGITRQESCTRSVLVKLEEQNSCIVKLQEQQQQTLLLIQHQMQQQQEGGRAPPLLLRLQSTADGGIGGDDGVGNRAGRRGEGIEEVDVGSVSYATNHVRRGQRMGYHALELLRGAPRTLIVDDKFPETWPDLVGEWRVNDLESFIKMNPKLWNSTALTQRYIKRHRAMKVLRKFRSEKKYHDDIEAAGKLEEVRYIEKISLTKHLYLLFQHDNQVKRRVRTAKVNNNNENN
jgi:hypothetical protein